jgi:hypothetical protein
MLIDTDLEEPLQMQATVGLLELKTESTMGFESV